MEKRFGSSMNNQKEERKKMVFLESAFTLIQETVGTHRCETGGILLGNRSDFVVQKFILDTNGNCSHSAYDPDVNFLNAELAKESKTTGFKLLGFVHSHPRGSNRLSGDYGNSTGDIGYLKTIFKHIQALDQFLVPIVYSDFDRKGFEVYPFAAYRDQEENYETWDLEILHDHEYKRNHE
jgi:hypothetical protein